MASLEKGAEGASGFGQALAPVLGVEHRMASCGSACGGLAIKGQAGRDGQAFFPAEGDELRFASGGGRLAASVDDGGHGLAQRFEGAQRELEVVYAERL